MQQKTCIQYLSTQNYLQGLSKSCCACIADLVVEQVQHLEGTVCLQEIERKDMVSGITGVKMHGKGASIVEAHFRSRWVKQSADTDRESLGKFDPAFVSDVPVRGYIQAGQARVHLQEIDRKGVVSGLLNRLQTQARVA